MHVDLLSEIERERYYELKLVEAGARVIILTTKTQSRKEINIFTLCDFAS